MADRTRHVDRFGNLRSALHETTVHWGGVAALLHMMSGQQRKSAIVYATQRALELNQYDAYLKEMAPKIDFMRAAKEQVAIQAADGVYVVDEFTIGQSAGAPVEATVRLLCVEGPWHIQRGW